MTMTRVEEKKRPLLWRLGRTPRPRRQAVIDIGSNSVRLIVYQINGRSIIPRINEKVMAGLGRDLSDTGRLSPEGVEAALAALARFDSICTSLGVTDIRAIATAAARDACDGPEFCETIRDLTGIRVEVLSGREEAHYAAMGVVAAQRDPTGLIGDLGGSSLELVTADRGVLGQGETYRLGPLALQAVKERSGVDLDEHIRDELTSRGKIPKADTFYAVGGAWRAFAKLYMHHTDYPLHVLQSYSLPASEAIELCSLVADGKSKIQSVAKDVAGKRYATLDLTARVLKATLEASNASKLSISAYGLREGIVYSDMSAEMRRLDPLLAGVTTLADPDTGQAGFSKALNDFLRLALAPLEPVFETAPDQEERLIAASFILADIGAMMHPDHRADIARQIVLRGPYTGIDHPGRIFLGLITGFRYNRKQPVTDLETSTLTEAQIHRAKVIAHLIRVAAEFSGRTERILRKAHLSVRDDKLVMTIAPGENVLVSEGVRKRLSQAANVMDLSPVIE